jgi:hypothetical protein
MTIDEEAKSLLLGVDSLAALYHLPYPRISSDLTGIPNTTKFFLVNRVHKDKMADLHYSERLIIDRSSLRQFDVIMGYYV